MKLYSQVYKGRNYAALTNNGVEFGGQLEVLALAKLALQKWDQTSYTEKSRKTCTITTSQSCDHMNSNVLC